MKAYKLLADVVSYHLGKPCLPEDLVSIQMNCDSYVGLADYAENHGIAPLFYLFIKQQKLDIDLELKRQFQSLALRHKYAAQVREKVLAQVIKLLKQNNIEILLLKGAALANMIYFDPMYRPMKDIDILLSKPDLVQAKLLLESIDFVFDDKHPSIYMGNIHHLPNAVKLIDSLQMSLELHHNVYSRDVPVSANFEQLINNAQTIKINNSVNAKTLDHISMLNHLCRHTFSSGMEVRLIHQYEILKYLQSYKDEISWEQLEKHNKFIFNTVRCLHYSVHIPNDIQHHFSLPKAPAPSGVGESMYPYTVLIKNRKTLTGLFKSLFIPSRWWMHVNYNVAPEQTLFWCYLLKHPLRLLKDISLRFYYAFKHKLSWSG